MKNTVVAASLWSACALPLLAAPILLATPTAARAQATVPHTFTYVAENSAEVQSVHVAGSFNNWDKGALAMTKDADGKTWRVTTALPYGKVTYKFVVNNDKWITDPNAQKNEDDGGGNVNSVFISLPTDYAKPASTTDGVIAKSALQHEQVPPFLNYDRGKLSVTFRTRPGDVRSVSVVANGKSYPLQKQTSDELYSRYAATIPWDRKTDLNYNFSLVDGAKTFTYGKSGLQTAGTKNAPFSLSAKTFKPFVVPNWVEKTVFYQIFPDRFDNGDKSNDPADVQSWDKKPTYFNRYGGDIAGVEKHVDYLASLGVGTVYFNPVFQSPSNHRYDAQDYRKIDPQFGTNAEFAKLTRDLQAHGIRTVMDFVFNHSATNFFAFQDIRDKGKASTYKDWYFIKSYPVKVQENPNYTAWYNFPSMPKFNVMNPPTHDYLLSLVDFWKKEVPLAGMRLDVANEVDPRFWRDLRVKAKGIDPNLWIVGEVWGDGSPWLKGDQWDSVMNYQFRDVCIRFFAEQNSTPTQFTDRLMALYGSYAPQVSRNMMNLLSSHDTPRFLTLCGNDANRDKLAATLQFTWVGAPSIYYGEELGMEGGADPDNRRGMEWEKAKADNTMLAYYKKLIALRNGSRALQSGDPKILTTNDTEGTLAFSRTLESDIAIVALNRSTLARTVQIPIPAAVRGKAFTNGLTGEKLTATGDTISVSLPPMGAAVFVK